MYKKFDMPCVKNERKIVIHVFKRMDDTRRYFVDFFDKSVVYYDQQTCALSSFFNLIFYSVLMSFSVIKGKAIKKRIKR